jgi:hypothetical protein
LVGHRHCIDAQTGWSIDNFVRDTRSNRIVKIKADNQTRTAGDPLPDHLRNAVITIGADVHTNLNQVVSDGRATVSDVVYSKTVFSSARAWSIWS